MIGSRNSLPWREGVRMSILVLVCVGGLACHAERQQNALEAKSRDAAVETLGRYLQLRLSNAHWNEYSKFITWPDEPAWDCKWVISKYDIRPSKKEGKKVTVPVVYMRLGLFCNKPQFEPSPKVVTVNYELVKRPSGWKVDGPTPDYPEISADVLMRSLMALAEKRGEAPERRAKAEATARKIGEALQRSRSWQ